MPRRLAVGLVAVAITLASPCVFGQSPVQACGPGSQPAWCSAAPGDRPGGWLSQHRSEVMACNGMVATSQPLAIMVVPDAGVVRAEGAEASVGFFRGGSDHRKDGQVVGY
jgi:hypothetical protein